MAFISGLASIHLPPESPTSGSKTRTRTKNTRRSKTSRGSWVVDSNLSTIRPLSKPVLDQWWGQKYLCSNPSKTTRSAPTLRQSHRARPLIEVECRRELLTLVSALTYTCQQHPPLLWREGWGDWFIFVEDRLQTSACRRQRLLTEGAHAAYLKPS